MTEADPHACEVCGEAVYYAGVGRRAKYCDLHKQQKNRARDSRAAAARGDKRAVERLRSVGVTVAPSLEGSELEGLAIALNITKGNVVAAGKMAQLAETGPALQALAKQAKKQHPGLVKLKPTAVAELGQQARATLLLQLRKAATGMPPQMLGAAIKQVGDSLATMTGGDGNVYAEVHCTIAAPSAKEVCEWAAKTNLKPETMQALLKVDW